ncbi:hypothetical protein K461DRAFT_275119 [Myriangium duriaei CBS 260.36]|uniref:BTB domain-containing protein n=1 Tax=Myriangium duriaei CBS 260.36 TaxID=1168546 RepID=A0A9P4MNA6_9PEZI|nr:hypothetical protein K461DRAFT_275119 [Myriangium duriaei CBS 260.36]
MESALSTRWRAQPLRLGNVSDIHEISRHDLPEQDPECFAIYVNYLHTGEISFKHKAGHQSWEILFQAYFLGNYLEDESFRNAVMDYLSDEADSATIRGSNQTTAWFPTASLAYRCTSSGSPLRSWLRDLHVWGWQGQFVAKLEARGIEPPFQFLRDVLEEIKQYWDSIYSKGESEFAPWNLENKCEYHEHTSNISRVRCSKELSPTDWLDLNLRS